MSADLSKQSVSLCHGSDARTPRHRQVHTHRIWQVPPRAAPPVPFLQFSLCFSVHLSWLSLLIPFHLLFVSSVSSHNYEFQQCPLSFSFIKRFAHAVAPVSLRAGVEGKSGPGAFMHLSLLRGRNETKCASPNLDSAQLSFRAFPRTRKKEKKNGRLAVQFEAFQGRWKGKLCNWGPQKEDFAACQREL